MDNVIFWNILRVLTTNFCNYNCTFCHNEGQVIAKSNWYNLKFSDFKIVIDALKNTSIKEVHFSGGEPFLNSETIYMIQYTNDNTNFEIGCATNAYFLTDVVINQLIKTRIKLNIQFPSNNQIEYKQITKKDYFFKLVEKLNILKANKINFGLNHVVELNRIDSVFSIIEYCISNAYTLKLLPTLHDSKSIEIKNVVFPFLDKYGYKKTDKGTGAIKWNVKNANSEDISIMYIDSPCFYQNIEMCRTFGEIRLLPELKLQTCIKSEETVCLKNEIEKIDNDKIIQKFEALWRNFTAC